MKGSFTYQVFVVSHDTVKLWHSVKVVTTSRYKVIFVFSKNYLVICMTVVTARLLFLQH